MKLIGSAKKYWQSIQIEIEQLGGLPITLWEVRKQRLKEKYLPFFP